MRIAMIGIKAIPARFGGFETAVDHISRGLVKAGHEVTVYNRAGMCEVSGNNYDGVKLVNVPTLRSKNLSTIVHSLFSTLHAMFTRVDAIHYFTTGATLWAPLARLTGKRTVCSVDGTDWQRAKWGRVARLYLRFSERLAVRFCDHLISDSEAVRAYYWRKYQANSSCIVYGMNERRSENQDCLQRFGLEDRNYVLFVGRFVPENNIHHLIDAFERTTTEKKLVLVGDDPWQKAYIRLLKSTRDSRVIFTGAIYGDGYVKLQQHAYLFVLPDEVGGTHPALVEAMGFGNCVLVNDTPSNLEVIGDSGFSYRGAEGASDLRTQLQYLVSHPETVSAYRQRAERRARERYRWDQVVENHAVVYEHVLRNGRNIRRSPAVSAAE